MPIDASVAVFVATLAATFVASLLGRIHAKRSRSEGLAGERLNKWLVGLSAGATANSGFVVTGAVGLGYAFGAQWLLLPLAWLIGDMLFWTLFPGRINRLGREANASTLTDVLGAGMRPVAKRVLQILASIVILVCLTGYVAAQWIAGEKFLEGAFGFEGYVALATFAGLIVLYTAIGGFRGSVYADSFQAVLRVVGTALALGAIIIVARQDGGAFAANIGAAGAGFLQILPNASWLAGGAFVAGYAAASLGFGLGQPQIVSRYLAGASPEETRAAWWIYILFVQFTWIAMTVFGMMLRGVMPALGDPEMGLSIFFRTYAGPLLTGLIVADVFATIAATSNSLLVAMAQTVKHDLFGQRAGTVGLPLWPITLVVGGLTMALASMLNATVVGLALSSVSLMGAGLAPAMLIRLLSWKQNDFSLIASIIAGLTVAIAWKLSGIGATLNEALPGLVAGLLANFLVWVLTHGRTTKMGGRG
ncbi:MAG: hypothetical protein GC145_08105 [Caulobacter sp.]|nr:hypothetical protein [Caulobacter sp.]